ncbi:MAG: glycosyltransferase [Candidatus Omnitrophota bacterium]
MLSGKTIVCYSGTNWGRNWGITQRAMTAFARTNKVIYIEYQPSFAHCWLRGASYIDYSSKGRGVFEKVSDNLTIYHPRPGLPFNNYARAVNVINQRTIAADIRTALAGASARDVILWAFVPYAIDFVNGLDRSFTVYHCAANYPAEKNNALRRRTVMDMESALTGAADLVVAQTRSLLKRFESIGKKTFYLPSAVEARYSAPDGAGASGRSPLLPDNSRPRIGIVGYFDDAFYDTDLLEYLVDARREWSFIFIGPVTGKARSFKKLNGMPNAVFLGYREPQTVPGLLKGMDVGIIPYKVNSFMDEVSPNKFYEYIACGVPVVSTSLPDLKDYGDVIKIAGGKEEFLKHIDYFLSASGKGSLREKAMETAARHSLDGYMERLSAVIEGAMR